MFADSMMGGVDMAFPDVCLTPTPAGPVPIPYPNIGAGPMRVPPYPKVLWMCTPAHNMSSVCPLTNGDNAGLATGVASGMVMGPARKVTAAFTVLVGGMPATRCTSVTIQNSTNVPGMQAVPAQVKVLLLAP
jgi:hypothetical protein